MSHVRSFQKLLLGREEMSQPEQILKDLALSEDAASSRRVHFGEEVFLLCRM